MTRINPKSFALKALNLRRRGYSFKQVGDELGCSAKTIQRAFKKHGLNDPLPRKNFFPRQSGADKKAIARSKQIISNMHAVRMHRARKLEALTR